MKNGLGVPQTIALFGGTSEIGQEIVSQLIRPGVGDVALVSRNIDAAQMFGDSIGDDSLSIHHIRFDGADARSMPSVVDEVTQSLGDIDVAIIAQALLCDGVDVLKNPLDVVDMCDVNFTATLTLLSSLAAQMKKQGYGRIVLLSSVAGERVRKANPAYGATKAGIDAFAQALDHELEGSGASILIVRPGFVTTKMTAGMRKAPFSSDAATVAKATVAAIDTHRRVIWVPGLLRFVFMAFRHLPTGVWRRLPLG
jgi:decaprenylphospho-beta-D-erythro-pentofuranosid-2-ulose 2-reductase